MRKLFVSNERTKQPVLFACVWCTIIILGYKKNVNKKRNTQKETERVVIAAWMALFADPFFSYSFNSVIKKLCFLAQKVMIRPLILVGDIKYSDVWVL